MSSVVSEVEVGCTITVLIVDDEPDMRFLARAVIEDAGIEVAAEAGDGLEALDALRVLRPPPVPTVIVLDNQMPGLTGLEVAAQILANRSDQLVVLFSAFLTDDMVAKATALGIAASVSKADCLELGTIIKQLVATRG
jgi:CheY-like chemotaxis protein